MKSYAEDKVFTEFDQNELALAIRVVEALPDHNEGEEPWRCHEVTRAVAHLIGGELAVIDGQFAGAQHSWIAYREPEGKQIRILDVYAVGRLPQVQLVDPSWSRGLGYTPDHLPRTDIDGDVIAFLVSEAERALESLVVTWPYHDCKVFTFGDEVYYREGDDGLEFWHPGVRTWFPSSRPTILEDACSLTTPTNTTSKNTTKKTEPSDQTL